MKKRVIRMYTGPDGESHFEDTEIVVEDKGGLGRSDLTKATGLLLQVSDNKHEQHWHNAPRRQYVVTLDGECEIEVGDGSKRVFRSGDMLLAEDTTGRGHLCRILTDKPWQTIFITLD
ncbi:hypothetical protein ACFLVQ_01590 [Chloroflexota bacterium]